MTGPTIGGLITVVVIAALAWVLYFFFFAPPVPPIVACTQEAKVCPDGSLVYRSGAGCQFAQCPSVNATTVPAGS